MTPTLPPPPRVGPPNGRAKFAAEPPIPVTLVTSAGPVVLDAIAENTPGGTCRWSGKAKAYVVVAGVPVRVSVSVVVAVEGSPKWHKD